MAENDQRRRPRRFERRRVALPVTIVDERGRSTGEIQFDTQDLSVGGAFLTSRLLFELDEDLEIEFILPGGFKVRARGRVARVSGDPPGMGIAFSALAEGDREAIREYLAGVERDG